MMKKKMKMKMKKKKNKKREREMRDDVDLEDTYLCSCVIGGRRCR